MVMEKHNFSSEIRVFEKALMAFRAGKISPEDFLRRRTRLGIHSLRDSNHYMIRIKVPAGVLRARGLRCVARIVRGIALESRLHITTRQAIEIHGIPEAQLVTALRWLGEAGLTTLGSGGNGVRNITCCPLSGVAPGELFDVTPYALGLTRAFLGNPRFETMPRKIKISFESCCADHVGTAVQDIGIQAMIDDHGRRGFRIWVGGGLGPLPMQGQLLESFTPERHLVLTIEEILHVFNLWGERKNRSRARLKFLVKKVGLDAFRKEVTRRRDQVALKGIDLKGSHDVGPSATSPQSSRKETPVPAMEYSKFARWYEANVKEQRQGEYCAVFIRCPLGDMSSDQASKIAHLADVFNGGFIRTSVSQNLVLRWIPRGRVEALYQELDAIGMATCCAEQIMDITRCVGGEACLSSITKSKSMALALEDLFLDGLGTHPDLRHVSIKVCGCPNACGHHHLANIGLFGVARQNQGRQIPAYQILLGGRAEFEDTKFGQKICAIPAARCVTAVERITKFFLEKRGTNEGFVQFVSRTGPDPIGQCLADLVELPTYEEDPSCYRDLGTDNEFKVRARRGECSA
jgi:sulfite reductase (ferredoxin)